MTNDKSPSESVAVLLVTDHPVIREGCRKYLSGSPPIRIIAEAEDGKSACERYAEHAPDVVVLDLNMGSVGGMEAIRRIRAVDSAARIVVFNTHDSAIMQQRTLQMGAALCLTRPGSARLADAVLAVSRGASYSPADGARAMQQADLQAVSDDPTELLTSREFQLFQLLAEGHSVSQIAELLNISPKTVGVHHTNIMKKLGLHNAAQLVRLALRCELIRP